MRCELITDFSRLEQLSPEWQRWSTFEGKPNVFLSWRWARAFWSAHQETVSLYVLAVHDGQRVAGLLPLIKRGQTIEFFGSPESDLIDILCEEQEAAQVLETALTSLLESDIDWTSGVLHNIPAESRIMRGIHALPHRLRRHLHLVFRNCAPTLQLGEDRQQVLNDMANRKKLRRSRNRLARLGPITYRHLETREEARRHLDIFFRQHTTRWAMTAVRSEFLEAERRAFLEALVEELDPASEFRLGVLEAGGQPVAYHVGLETGGKFISYRASFSSDYWSYYPGDVTLRYLFYYSRDRGVDEFDFSLGDEPYKFHYANRLREVWSLHLERQPFSPRAQARHLVQCGLHVVRRNRKWKTALKAKAAWWEDLTSGWRWEVGGATLPEHYLGRIEAAGRRLAGRGDEVLVYVWRASGARPGPVAETARLTMDRLADLFADYPDSLNAIGIREYRSRLESRQQSYVVMAGSGDPFVVWMAQPGTATDTGGVLPETAAVIDAFWTRHGANSGPIPPAVLQALAEHLAVDAIGYRCSGRAAARKAGIVSAGFQFRGSYRQGSAVGAGQGEAPPASSDEEEVVGAHH